MNQKIFRFRIAAASFVLLFLTLSLYLISKDLGTFISQQRKLLEQAAKTAALWIPQQSGGPRQNSQTLTYSQLSEALFRAELDLVIVADLDLIDLTQAHPVIVATSHPRHKVGDPVSAPQDLLDRIAKRQTSSTSLEWSEQEWKMSAAVPVEGSNRWAVVVHAPQGAFVWSLITHILNYIVLCLGLFILLAAVFSPFRLKSRAKHQEDPTASDEAPWEQKHQLLQQQLVTDPLTKIFNRAYFDYFISGQHLRWVALDGCSMLVIDIDNFKKINDKLGHSVGDEVLLGFAQFLRSFFRKSDKVIRYGGDEFVVMLSGTKTPEAFRISQNLIQSLKSQNFGTGIKITVSVGVAEYILGESGKAWFERADAALYNVKHSGKDSVQSLDSKPLELLQ